MEEFKSFEAAQPVSDIDVVSQALAWLHADGAKAISASFALLRHAGVELTSPDGQAVVVEAIFHLLEALELDLANAEICWQALCFEREVADIAVELLSIVNFGDGKQNLEALSDSTILVFAALKAASGDRQAATQILQQSAFARPQQEFQQAAAQLQILMQDDSRGVMQRLFEMTLDGLDHPEIWPALKAVVTKFPDLIPEIELLLDDELGFYTEFWAVIHALCVAASGEVMRGWSLLTPLATAHSQSAFTQGAFFYIQSLLDPENPIFDLKAKFCSLPFEVFEVLDGKTHLCCASWLQESVGDLAQEPWEQVWNSESAQAIRTSILDGSFRHCNKTACPKIAAGKLPKKADLISGATRWRDVIANFETRASQPPQRVNLAYDQTCNLSCPSCRTGQVAADSAMRKRFDDLQEREIFPLLKTAKLVLVTGSGDPFASKNFRNLLERLGPKDYPYLRFQIMTNGMLFTPREWARFPALHGRVAYLRISLDAATGPTHERLRRGARWSVMEANLAFAAELRSAGLIDRLEISFTVQVDNFAEMGDAVDLARFYNADNVAFTRLTNWGTFTAEQYAQKAVFMPDHPQHGEFLQHMGDPRLRDPIASLLDLLQYAQKA